MTVLVIAEHDGKILKAGTFCAIAAAQKLSSDIHLMLIGSETASLSEAASQAESVTEVITATSPQLAEPVAELALEEIKNNSYSHVIFVASTLGKSAMPRVAAKLGVPAISEVVEILSADTIRRFIYAGSILATVQVKTTPVIMTIRQTAFDPVASIGGNAPVRELAHTPSARTFEVLGLETVESDRPDLLNAKRVVSGGRGIIDETGFEKLQAFADKIGAAVGSTRALVDAQISTSDTQVGQTGKIVAPELYFAFGISGAIQHIAGMKDSRVIVSVNKDPEAPIFDISDYYLVADAVEVLEEMTQKL